MRKRKIKNTVILVILLLAVGFIAALPQIVQAVKKDDEKLNAVSAKVKKADINITLSGTGTLTEENSEEASVPHGVEITRYYVKNGDTVKKGQSLASVDKVSVLNAMASVQETIDYLNEEMTKVQDSAYAQSIRDSVVSAPAAGTVKAVYAQLGDDVQKVTLEHGCLAILDIDGQEWKAQAYSGTISYVGIEEGQKVYFSNVLFSLDDTIDYTQLDIYTAQHREYENIMQQLAQMYRDGMLVSPCDGVISGIDEEAADRLEKEHIQKLKAAGLAAVNVSEARITVENIAFEEPGRTGAVGQVTNITGTELSVRFDEPIGAVTVTLAENSMISEPENGKSYFFIINTEETEEGMKTVAEPVYSIETTPVSTPQPSMRPAGNGGFDMSALAGMFGGSRSGGIQLPGAGMSGASADSEFTIYPTEAVTVMSVTPQNIVSVSMTVDELDVLSVSVGQEAKVTVDALPGREYTGHVTTIDKIGDTSSGGNAKYTIEITLAREKQMLSGMNASCSIVIASYPSVLTVPAASLTEKIGKTVVYTSLSSQGGLLSGEKEVTTGVSDGNSVQILSGLSEGETVYYDYTDELKLDIPAIPPRP